MGEEIETFFPNTSKEDLFGIAILAGIFGIGAMIMFDRNPDVHNSFVTWVSWLIYGLCVNRLFVIWRENN